MDEQKLEIKQVEKQIIKFLLISSFTSVRLSILYISSTTVYCFCSHIFISFPFLFFSISVFSYLFLLLFLLAYLLIFPSPTCFFCFFLPIFPTLFFSISYFTWLFLPLFLLAYVWFNLLFIY